MLPPDGTVRAALRWLELLSRSSFEQAVALIKAEPSYADLSMTQYAAAIEWLKSTALVIVTEDGLALSSAVPGHASSQLGSAVFTAALEDSQPAWLATADELIADDADLPGDAAQLATAAGITTRQAALSVLQVHRKLDLEERARVGSAGERALVALLARVWPGSVSHVALTDDGLGYDVEFRHDSGVWHLEVKSTTRRGRLAIYLSRHEHDISRLDPSWRLVAVGLGSDDQICAVATAHTPNLLSRAPRDLSSDARWESVRHLLRQEDLAPGLPFIGRGLQDAERIFTACNSVQRFDWMPGVRVHVGSA
jgi:hypothetical protein